MQRRHDVALSAFRTRCCAFAKGRTILLSWLCERTECVHFPRQPIYCACRDGRSARSEEHTSELQSLMRISYAVFCLKKKKTKHNNTTTTIMTKYKHNTKIKIQMKMNKYT